MKLILLFTSLFVIGCESRRGYEATFEAPKSRITARVRAIGVYRDNETLRGLKGYSQIVVCPMNDQTGRELRFEEIADEIDEAGETVVKLVGPMGTNRWYWGDASQLKELLKEYGYSNLDDNEINRLNHALHHSVVGTFLEGQGREINVSRVTIDDSPKFDRTAPPNKWLEPTTALAPCHSSRPL